MSRGGNDKSAEAQRRELDRVGAFSDGVFAVAITLLVLNIEVPDVPSGERGLDDALVDLLPSVQAYFIAFAVIGLFWYGHHVAWSRLERSSGKLVAANLLLLSLIGLMPFTTALIGGSYVGNEEAVAVSVYALNVGLAALADSLMDRIVIRDGLAMPSSPYEQRAQLVGGWLRTGIFFVSIPIAFLISPTVAEFIWLGLLFTTNLSYRLVGDAAQPESPPS
jgi:TMEM175 potassium channel family protein